MNLKACDAIGRGWVGLYFRLSDKMGVKAIRNKPEAFKEAKTLQTYNSKVPYVFPRFYKLEKVFVCGIPHFGIFMEHIVGKSGLSMTRSAFKTKTKKLINDLKLKGIKLEDFYRENAIFQKNGRIRVIDVGSKFLSPIRKELCFSDKNK